DWLCARASHLGPELVAPSTCPWGGSGRGTGSRWVTLGILPPPVLPARTCAQRSLSRQILVLPGASLCPRAGSLSRSTGADGGSAGLCGPADGNDPDGVGGLRQAAVWRPPARASVPGTLHAPGGDLEPPLGRYAGRPGAFPLERLCPWASREGHD